MRNKGFTLIELSIVIVIIGLIVAGVIGGQNLIHQAKMRNIISDFDKTLVALRAFQLKYNDLPGDMEEADSYWTSCADETNNTCNGDGDGIVESTAGSQYEHLRAYQHLSLAEIIPQSFTGLIDDSVDEDYGLAAGINVATGSLAGSVLAIWNNNKLVFSKLNTSTTIPDTAVINPRDAFQLDTKMDDGVPNAGVIRGIGSDCFTTSTYDLDDASVQCYIENLMMFKDSI